LFTLVVGTSPAEGISHFTSGSDIPLHLWQAIAVGSRNKVQVSAPLVSEYIININYSTESQTLHYQQ